MLENNAIIEGQHALDRKDIPGQYAPVYMNIPAIES